MGKGIATLVRVNEWTVDERRRDLGALLDELNEIETSKANLETQFVSEQSAATRDPEIAGVVFGPYADATMHQIQYLKSLIESKEEEITLAQEKLGEAYRELKKFEIARDNHRKKSLEDLIRRDQRELDELALQAINFRERK
jgi:flagellar export protein FliJ